MQLGYEQWTGSDVAQDFRPLVRLRRTRGDMTMVFEMWVMLRACVKRLEDGHCDPPQADAAADDEAISASA